MATTYSQNKIVTDGLVLYLDAANYKSYQSGSTIWNNLMDNSTSGSLINGSTFDSGNGGSIVFDGVDDYCDLGNIFNFDYDDTFTLNIWFKTTGNTSAIIGKFLEDNLDDKGYYLGWDSNGKIRITIASRGVSNERFLLFSSFSLTQNQWYNLCLTYDGSNSTNGVGLYINGESDGFSINNNGNLSGGITSSTSSFCIGSYYNNTTSAFNGFFGGNVANSSVYNRALSSQEILQNYNAQKSRFNLP